MSSASNQKLFCGICSAFKVLSMNLWGESGLSVLFLRHLRTASDLSSALYLHSKLSFHSASDLGCKWNWTECLYVCLFLSLSSCNYPYYHSSIVPLTFLSLKKMSY